MPGLLSYDQDDVESGKIILKPNGSIDPTTFGGVTSDGLKKMVHKFSKPALVPTKIEASVATSKEFVKKYTIDWDMASWEGDPDSFKEKLLNFVKDPTQIVLDLISAKTVSATVNGIAVHTIIYPGHNLFYRHRGAGSMPNTSSTAMLYKISSTPSIMYFNIAPAGTVGNLSLYLPAARTDITINPFYFEADGSSGTSFRTNIDISGLTKCDYKNLLPNTRFSVNGGLIADQSVLIGSIEHSYPAYLIESVYLNVAQIWEATLMVPGLGPSAKLIVRSDGKAFLSDIAPEHLS